MGRSILTSTLPQFLPSMDMTSKENIESAAKADAPSGGVSGKYVVTVAQASFIPI